MSSTNIDELRKILNDYQHRLDLLKLVVERIQPLNITCSTSIDNCNRAIYVVLNKAFDTIGDLSNYDETNVYQLMNKLSTIQVHNGQYSVIEHPNGSKAVGVCQKTVKDIIGALVKDYEQNQLKSEGGSIYPRHITIKNQRKLIYVKHNGQYIPVSKYVKVKKLI